MEAVIVEKIGHIEFAPKYSRRECMKVCHMHENMRITILSILGMFEIFHSERLSHC